MLLFPGGKESVQKWLCNSQTGLCWWADLCKVLPFSVSSPLNTLSLFVRRQQSCLKSHFPNKTRRIPMAWCVPAFSRHMTARVLFPSLSVFQSHLEYYFNCSFRALRINNSNPPFSGCKIFFKLCLTRDIRLRQSIMWFSPSLYKVMAGSDSKAAALGIYQNACSNLYLHLPDREGPLVAVWNMTVVS